MIEKTIAVPYGSADAERAFRAMNLIKTNVRTSLILKSVNAQMKIAMSEDSIVQEFNAETSTEIYAQDHQLCD